MNTEFNQELFATDPKYRAGLSTDFDFDRFVADEAYRNLFQLQYIGNNMQGEPVYNVGGTIYFVRLNKDGRYTWL